METQTTILSNIYELAFLKSPLSEFIYSKSGELRVINRAGLILLGIENAECIQPYNLYDSKIIDRFVINSLQVGETVKFNTQLDFDEMRNAGFLNTGRTGSIYISTDITVLGDSSLLVQVEEIQKEQGVSAPFFESEKYLKNTSGSAPLIVWMTDVAGNFIYFNKGWLGFTGSVLEKELSDGWKNNIPPEDYESFRESFSLNFRKHKPFKMVCRLKRYDGEYRWMLFNAIPRFLNSTNFTGYIGTCTDISEQKKYNSPISEREKKFIKTFYDGPFGVAIVALSYKYIHVNEAFCSLVQYKKNELVGKPLMDITYPADLKMGIKYSNRLISKELEQAGWVKRYVRKNGEIVWAKLSVALLKDNSGNPLFFLQIVEDITGRKQIERKLVYSERKYKSLISSIPFGICILSKGRIVYCNSKFCTMVESSNRMLVYGWPLIELINKEDRGRVVNSYLMRYEKKASFPFAIEFKAVTMKGSIKDWKVYNTEYSEDDKSYIQSLVLDVSGKIKNDKRKQRLLAESIFTDRKNKLAERLKTVLMKIISNYKLKDKDRNRIERAFSKFLDDGDDWERFKTYFEGIYGESLTRLKQAFPSLTQNELRHCAYIKLKFTTKDIALLNNVKDTSVQRSRVRLKKKLGLSQKDDLYGFLEIFN